MLRSITVVVAVAFPIFSAVLLAPDAVAARATVPAADPNDVNKAPSTCPLRPAGCKRLAVGMGDLLATRAANFHPDLECLGPGSSILCGSDMSAAEVEQVIDLIVG